MDNSQAVNISQYQKRFWLEWQLNPQSIAYNTPLIYQITGLLNIEALSYALNTFVNYYDEGCRSYFKEDSSGLKQIILPNVAVTIEKHYFDVFPNQTADIQTLITPFLQHRFDLRRVGLYKFDLISLQDQNYILILNFHHIISDAVTAKHFIDIVSHYYNHYFESAETVTHKAFRPIADYIEHEQTTYSEKDKQCDLQYWETLLQDTSLYLQLPNHPNPSTKIESDAIYFNVDRNVTHALKKMLRTQQTSLFILLTAAFSSLLLRYANQTSAVINYPVNMRPPGFREKTGCFVNNVLFKIERNPQHSFEQLLQELTYQRRNSKKHQRCSLTDIVQHLRYKGILTSEQFFNIDLYEAFLGSIPLDLKDLHVQPLQLNTFISNDMGLAYQVLPDEIQFKLEFQKHKFDKAFITKLIFQLKTLLNSILDNIKILLYSYPLLTDQEVYLITKVWNQTQTHFPNYTSVIDLFENIVSQYAERSAIKHYDTNVTYGELSKRANQLAHYLLQQGVKPGQYVALYMERSPELITSMLAVLKVGAAYIPLDLKLPIERLQHIIQDAQPTYVLVTSVNIAFIAKEKCIQVTEGLIQAQPISNVNHIKQGYLPAYVIYTSGSTGQPKGVVINHAGLLNHNFFVTSYYGIKLQDKILQLSTISFDISVEEIFMTLTNGATVVLYPDEVGLSFTQFKKILQNEKISVLDLPTAFWHAWVNELQDAKELAGLKLVIVGGEQANLNTLKKWQTFAGSNVRWVNTYGPTEATIIAAVWEPHNSDISSLTKLPIGRPIANGELYILDEYLNPVPIGVTGELMIAGEQLAQGYLNQPVLTAEKFIPHPFSQKPGDRLYRTGDLARYNENGEVEYLGRLDQQIKIRGFRVELGDIESAISAYASIKQVVVIATQLEPIQLIAYIVLKANAILDITHLKTLLQKQLPDYMVPSQYITIDKIPLTSNGKTDVKKLPIPTTQSKAIPILYANIFEKTLLDIWREVLPTNEIGLEDSFFELGGNSLLMLKAHNKIESWLQREIPIVKLFQHPTIKTLANFLQDKQQNVVDDVMVSNANKQRRALEKQRHRIKQRIPT